jgi:hypothetical protein
LWTQYLPATSEDAIYLLDLDSGEKREVLREKVNGSIWSISAFSQGRAIIEKDSDENHGGGADIYLLDLASGSTQALSTDGKSDMPHLSYPWAMWKAGPRYDTASQIGVYNLQTRQKEIIPLQGVDPNDPVMDGTRVYWTTSSLSDDLLRYTGSIYVFDIIKNTTSILNTSGDDERFDAVAIHGDLIVWIRITHAASSADYRSYLEWTTIQ